MQLRKTLMMLTALSALSVVMTGCPSDEEGSLTCSLDADCLEGEICHPTAKVCVQTCSVGDDCPTSAKTCKEISTTDTRKVCQCATSNLCSQELGADFICSDLDKVCTTKCTETSCGTGRTCDTATGQCKAGGGNTGTDCTYGSCTGGQVCNATTNKCEAAATCSGEAQSTCTYGQFCSTGKCADAPKPTCTNLEGKAVTSFTPATGTGYIIYDVKKSEFGGTTGCGAGTQRIVPLVSFYTKDGTLPTTEDLVRNGFYVKTTKEEIALNAGNMFGYTRSADGKSASVKVFLCGDDTLTEIQLGFYFSGGNGYCAQLTK